MFDKIFNSNIISPWVFNAGLKVYAGVVKWQTQVTQNHPPATACRFKSGLRHH